MPNASPARWGAIVLLLVLLWSAGWLFFLRPGTRATLVEFDVPAPITIAPAVPQLQGPAEEASPESLTARVSMSRAQVAVAPEAHADRVSTEPSDAEDPDGDWIEFEVVFADDGRILASLL